MSLQGQGHLIRYQALSSCEGRASGDLASVHGQRTLGLQLLEE